MDRDQIWHHIHTERRALADLLAGLSDEEWDHPTLCEGWRVREVAAHVISSPAMTLGPMLRAAASAGFRYNHMVDREARRRSGRPAAEILAEFTRYDGSRRHPPGTSVRDPLIDVLVHTQDIAVPLGRANAMPVEAAVAALDRARGVSWIFGTRKQVSGLRLEATDAEWSAGRGEPVRAPAQELLLLVCGRPNAALPT